MRRLLLALVAGLVCVPALAGGGVTVKAKGAFRDGVYTSPDKSFSVRMPDLVSPGIVIEDQSLPDGEGVVYFRDDFCRQYYVHDIPLVEPYVTQAEVERFAREGIAEIWARTKQATLESVTPVDIGRGPAAALRQREPSGPCGVMTVVGGKMARKAVPADVLTYLFVADGAAYEVGVMVGETGGEAGFFTGEPKTREEMLGAFLAGLETHPHAQKLQKNGLREGIVTRVAGQFVAGDYVAADGGYRLKLPLLHGAAEIAEPGGTVPDETMLVLTDGLCRSYFVHRMPLGALTDEQMQELADNMGRTFVDLDKASNLVIEPLDLGRGDGKALRMRYETPPRPCDIGATSGRSQPEVVPVDFTIFVFREGEIVYEVAYQRARVTAASPFFTRREPADELLRELVSGLREGK